MTKNQKIALGCGGAGCLGLIFIAIVVGVVWFLRSGTTRLDRHYNFNVSTNRNDNSTVGSNSNGNSSSPSTSSISMSDDDKHKLYQAAGMTGDTEQIKRVSAKIGLMNDDSTTNDAYVPFIEEHAKWAYRNGDFILSLNTKEKALAYVNEHLPE